MMVVKWQGQTRSRRFGSVAMCKSECFDHKHKNAVMICRQTNKIKMTRRRCRSTAIALLNVLKGRVE